MMKNIVALVFFLAVNNHVFGQLKVSENKRYLEDVSGKPFLWIGDTAWELFHKLDRKEADRYLTKRARQGFTVIQAVILAEDDGLKKPNSYGEVPLIELNPEKPNLKYFEHVDYIIKKAEQLGLYVALLPTWADKVPNNRPGIGPIVFNKKNAGIFGEFLGKRYGKNNVIWILGGDRNIDNQTALNIWRAMAAGIKKEDQGRNLMSYHPAGENSSSTYQEEWIDFNMYQSGHAHYYMPVYKFAKKDYDTNPRKPFLDSEPAYEDIPVKFWQYINWDSTEKVPAYVLNKDNTIKDPSFFKAGYFTDYDVRVHAYWNFLSGACGYTYGNNAVWQMFKKNKSFTIPCLTDWKKALKSPGANNILFMRRLFEKVPFHKLEPNQSIILSEFANDSTYISAATTKDSSTALVYLAKGQKVTLALSHLKSKYISASWYNPGNGKFSKFARIRKANQYTFVPPRNKTNIDRLLVLKSTD